MKNRNSKFLALWMAVLLGVSFSGCESKQGVPDEEGLTGTSGPSASIVGGTSEDGGTDGGETEDTTSVCPQPNGYGRIVLTDTNGNEYTWLDRNLGATKVATTFADKSDPETFGKLYQWGRGAEGHEERDSALSEEQADSIEPTIDTAWYGRFITQGFNPDWIVDDVVQGTFVERQSNWGLETSSTQVCPTGYVVPSKEDFDFISSNARDNATLIKELNLPFSGFRETTGAINTSAIQSGQYWTRDFVNSGSQTSFNFLNVRPDSSLPLANYGVGTTSSAASGYAVRCICASSSVDTPFD